MGIDSKTGRPTILARDAEVGKLYLVAGLYYKVKVVRKHVADTGEVFNVSVDSESLGKKADISGGTELIEYDQTLHVPFERNEIKQNGIKQAKEETVKETGKENTKVGKKPSSSNEEIKALVLGEVKKGIKLQKEIVASLGLLSVSVNIALRALVDEGKLVRTKEGKKFIYSEKK